MRIWCLCQSGWRSARVETLHLLEGFADDRDETIAVHYNFGSFVFFFYGIFCDLAAAEEFGFIINGRYHVSKHLYVYNI